MELTDAELELHQEWSKVKKAFLAAKEKRDKDPKAYDKAEAALSEMRRYWRQVGEATPDGVPGHRTPHAPVGGGARNRIRELEARIAELEGGAA